VSGFTVRRAQPDDVRTDPAVQCQTFCNAHMNPTSMWSRCMTQAPELWLAQPRNLKSSFPVLLLAMATGAVDAISFMTLGGVFTSVMTANLALFGLAIATHDVLLAGHAALAIVAYTCGVLLGSRVASLPGRARWSGARIALLAEVIVMTGAMTAWAALDGKPAGTTQLVLLAAMAVCMGCQGGMIRVAGGPNLSTTYMTGALTGALVALAVKKEVERYNIAVIVMLPTGAGLGALLVTHARAAALALPLVLLTAALTLSFRRPELL
jgi:uncharacterized membrane protein YoaK (UPF0700 family)